MNGILNVNKPQGMSSFKCLSIVKRKLWEQLPLDGRPKLKNWKVGFLGTLDPLASGVLVLLCGRATKLADMLHQGSKVYRSTFTFGKETTTLDNEGEIVATSDIIPTKEQILAALPDIIGEIEIEVPKYSAVHINGTRAYELARKGIEFEVPKRVVKIDRFGLLEQRNEKEFFFEIECNAGTYIRSLAKLMAQKLGTVAIASEIIRVRVGEFDIKEAKSPDDVTLEDITIL